MSDRKDHIKVLKQFLKDYQEWGESLEIEESVKFAINSLEVDEAYTKFKNNEVYRLYKQVCKERDIAIEQLHELGYEFGEKFEPTPTITLDELKEIREEIDMCSAKYTLTIRPCGTGQVVCTEYLLKDNDVLEIIDKKIAELEGK